MLTVVEFFGFGWWDAADVVEEAAVAEPVDPFHGGELEVVEAFPGAFVADVSGFAEADDGLGQGVVVAVSSGAGGGGDVVGGEALCVADGQVLAGFNRSEWWTSPSRPAPLRFRSQTACSRALTARPERSDRDAYSRRFAGCRRR